MKYLGSFDHPIRMALQSIWRFYRYPSQQTSGPPWFCWVLARPLAQHQPQGAAENNLSMPRNQPSCTFLKQKGLSCSCNTYATKIIQNHPMAGLYVVIVHQHTGNHQTQEEVNVLVSCRRRLVVGRSKNHRKPMVKRSWETAGWWLWMMNRGANGYLLKLSYHIMS